jgi:hypothetical protein
MCLYDPPHHGQPPLRDRKNEKTNTGPNHRTRRSGCPTEKPEVIANGKMEISYHIAHIHGHSLVHACHFRGRKRWKPKM